MDELALAFGSVVGLTALTIAALTLLKQAIWPEGGEKQDRWAGLLAIPVAVVFALIGSLFVRPPDGVPADGSGHWAYYVALGIVSGLSAVGTYTAAKRALGQ